MDWLSFEDEYCYRFQRSRCRLSSSSSKVMVTFSSSVVTLCSSGGKALNARVKSLAILPQPAMPHLIQRPAITDSLETGKVHYSGH